VEAKFEQLRTDNPQLTVLGEWASEGFKQMSKKNYN
jgi:hypothetical protein